MPLVEVEQVMPIPLERSWEVITRLESYTDSMEHVRSMEVLERGPDHRVSAWEVDLKGCVMHWVEHETFDSARHRIEYRQVEGDLAQFEGYWQLHPLTEDTTSVVLAVSFDIGVPMMSEMLDPIAEKAIAENSRAMLSSLAARAHESVT